MVKRKRCVPKRRSNNQGTVSANRAIDRYTVIWKDKNGIRHTRSTFPLTPDGRRQAEQYLQKVLDLKDKGTVPDDRLTLAGCIRLYMTERNATVRASTASMWANLVRSLTHICPALLNARISEITTQRLDDFYRDLPLSPSYIHRFHMLIRASLQYAVFKNLLPYNPARHATLPMVKKKDIKVLTWKEIGKVFLFLKKQKRRSNRLSNDYILWFRILHGTGIRVGELLALRWSNVDIQKRRIFIDSTVSGDNGIFIEKPKTESGNRYIPIFSSKTLSLLQAAKENAKNDYVCSTSTGGRVRYSNLIREWSLIRNATGITATLHCWRHTAASLWLSVKRLPLASVSAMLGHSSPAITLSIYTHAMPYDTDALIRAYNLK